MSRVSKAIATIDKAVSLGYISEEMAFELKHLSFENSAEFNELYNLVMCLNDYIAIQEISKKHNNFSKKFL